MIAILQKSFSWTLSFKSTSLSASAKELLLKNYEWEGNFMHPHPLSKAEVWESPSLIGLNMFIIFYWDWFKSKHLNVKRRTDSGGQLKIYLWFKIFQLNKWNNIYQWYILRPQFFLNPWSAQNVLSNDIDIYKFSIKWHSQTTPSSEWR